MAVSGVTTGSSALLYNSRATEESGTAVQTAGGVQISVPGTVSSSTSTSETAPAGAPKGGIPIAASSASEEEELEAALAAALARAQALVGATEAENVVNDDGSINYAELARIVAEKQASAQDRQADRKASDTIPLVLDIEA